MASVLAEIEIQTNPMPEVLTLPGRKEQNDNRVSKGITQYATQYMKKVSMPVVVVLNENNVVSYFLEYDMHAVTIPASSVFTRDCVSTMKNDVATDALPYFPEIYYVHT